MGSRRPSCGDPLPGTVAHAPRLGAVVRALALAIVAASLTLAGAPSPAVAEAEQTASVSGVVTGPNGQPLAGILVNTAAIHEDDYAYRGADSTDDSGRFVIDGLEPGEYTLAFFDNSWRVNEWWNDKAAFADADRFILEPGTHLVGMDARLSRSSVAGVVRGPSGDGIPGARVSLYGPDGSWSAFGWLESRRVDSSGSYRFDGLLPGRYGVFVEPPAESGLVGQWWPESPYSSGAMRFDVGLDEELSGIDMRLAAASRVEGMVTDDLGAPLAGALVGLTGDGEPNTSSDKYTHFVRTDSDGRYEFAALAADTYRLAIKPPDGPNLLDWNSDAFSVSRESTARVDAALLKGGSLSGVVRGRDGAAIASVALELHTSTGARIAYTNTDENGYYRFQRIVAGDYRLHMTPRPVGSTPNDDGYLTGYWPVTAPGASASFLSIRPGEQVALDPVLTPEATISGRVVDAAGAVTDVSAQLYAVTESGFTFVKWADRQDDGRYRFDDVGPGEYTLSFGSPYHVGQWWGNQPRQSLAHTFHVGRGEVLTGFDAILTPGASIAGTVSREESSTPLSVVSLYSVGTTGDVFLWSRTVGVSGQFRFGTLPPGDYKLKFADYDGVLQQEWWGDSSGAAEAKTITLGADESVTGIDAHLEQKSVSLDSVRITGSAVAGDELRAVVGMTSPPACIGTGCIIRLSYEWFADGAVTPGTASSLPVRGALEGKQITVRVTASLPYHKTSVMESAPTAAVTLPPVVPGKPSVTGTPVVGATLTATSGTWPAGSVLKFQWLASGLPIKRATGETLTLTSAEAGKTIAFRVTCSLWEHAPTTATAVAPHRVARAVTPTVTGIAATGSTLRAVTGTWTSGTAFTYEWRENGVPIPGATKSALLLKAAQAGKRITVEVTGSVAGFPTVAKVSAATGRVYLAPTPVISGKAVVGSTLTAKRGSWTSGSTFAYQWYANGGAVKGATSATLKLTSAYAGKKITVRVTGRLTGYPTTSRTSAATPSVAR